MKQPNTVIQCPTCGRPVEWGPEQRWRPFCSERCRLIDLGEWLDEKHRIPSEPGSQTDSKPHDED